MPIRCVTSPISRLIAAAALLLSLTGAVARADPAPPQQLTLAEARVLAVRALEVRRPELTLQLTGGLLQATPKDPFLHYLRSHAHVQRNEPRAARLSAARAYRFADPGIDRFEAAQLAAKLSVAEDRLTLAQLWLRRSAIHAPSPKIEALVARDYRAVRVQNPLSFRLRAELKPSDNVNNGADTAFQIIDGVPAVGFLSGAARALSGVVGILDMSAAYRLRADASSATHIGGRLYVQQVALSSEAQRIAPTVDEDDFNSTYAEVSIRHGFAVGRNKAWISAAGGQSWAAQARNYRFARLSGEHSWTLSNTQQVSVSALAETRFDARFSTNNANILGLGARYRQVFGNGDRLTFSLALRDTKAEHFNGTFRTGSFRASYGLGNPVGPMRLTAGLSAGYSDYPIFQSGLFFVPGGRQDSSVYGDLTMMFDKYDYAGFAPTVRLLAGRRSSNDSRYDISEFSISLGIESKF